MKKKCNLVSNWVWQGNGSYFRSVDICVCVCVYVPMHCYNLSRWHVRIIKCGTFLLTLKALDKERLEPLRINLTVLSFVSQRNELTLSVILNQFKIGWKQWPVIIWWVTQFRYSCKRQPSKNMFRDIRHILTALSTRPRLASFHSHVTTKLHVAISHLLVRRTK